MENFLQMKGERAGDAECGCDGPPAPTRRLRRTTSDERGGSSHFSGPMARSVLALRVQKLGKMIQEKFVQFVKV